MAFAAPPGAHARTSDAHQRALSRRQRELERQQDTARPKTAQLLGLEPPSPPPPLELRQPRPGGIFADLHGNDTQNFLFAEFRTGDLTFADVDFAASAAADYVEFYDVDADKWQMNNTARTLPAATRKRLHDQLQVWYTCAGKTCP